MRDAGPVYSLKLRNRKKKRYLQFSLAMPERAGEESKPPLWKCTLTVRRNGRTITEDIYSEAWTGTIVMALEFVRRLIPETEEQDWETPEGLPVWCVFPKTVPIGWGYGFHHRVWDMVQEEDAKFQQAIERKWRR